MRYVKITSENAADLVTEGAVLAHCKEVLPGSEADEINVDRTVDIANRIDSNGVTIILPDGTDSPRYEIDYFTDGNWWIEDFAKRQIPKASGSEYMCLVCGTILLLLSIDMFFNDVGGFSGFYGPGRFGGVVSSGIVSVLLFSYSGYSYLLHTL